MKKPCFDWMYFLLLLVQVSHTAPSLNTESAEQIETDNGPYHDITPAVVSIAYLWPNCSYLLITDGRTPGYEALVKVMSAEFQGAAMFDASVVETHANLTVSDAITSVARQVRRHFLCVIVVVVSDDQIFLESFAKSSLKNRLLSRTSALIAVSRLRLLDMDALSTHWTFSLFNAVFLIPDFEENITRWNLYSHLPFSASGSQWFRLGHWQRSRGLVLKEKGWPLSPRKFANFYGAAINTSVLPYTPYWMEETNAMEEVVISGSDKLMLDVMQSKLNFTTRALNVTTWDEVLQRVADREAWITTVIIAVYPARLKRFDFTTPYEYDINQAFVMAKPVLEPKWQSLYYPLTNEVWLSIMATFLIVCLGLIGVIRGYELLQEIKELSSGPIILEVFGTLLGQGLSDRLPVTISTRLLLILWLIFAFVVGTIYKGNLVASIVAPRYPPRPETLEELVKVVKKVTMPNYGDTIRDIMRNSETSSLEALGNMMELGYDIDEGLRLTLNNKYPHLGSLRFIQYQVAEHYTEADGTSPLYLGREGVMPILNAWPIPHDAPFKAELDFIIVALTESGIYNKWVEKLVDEAKKVGRQRRRRQLEEEAGSESSGLSNLPTEAASDGKPRALTTVHFQGPLLILGFGLVFAGMAFITESLIFYYLSAKTTALKLELKEQTIKKLF